MKFATVTLIDNGSPVWTGTLRAFVRDNEGMDRQDVAAIVQRLRGAPLDADMLPAPVCIGPGGASGDFYLRAVPA